MSNGYIELRKLQQYIHQNILQHTKKQEIEVIGYNFRCLKSQSNTAQNINVNTQQQLFYFYARNLLNISEFHIFQVFSVQT